MRTVRSIVTAPAALPVSVAEAKTHMRVTGTADDTIIALYLNAAIALAEQYLQRKLITQTWKMYLDLWPSIINVHFGDLQSVTHVKYFDIDDTEATYSSASYYVDTVSIPGRILRKSGYAWPSVALRVDNPIEIQFITGYGDDSTDVPDDIRSAVLMLTAHFYENREMFLVSSMSAVTVEAIPWSVEALLSPHRVWRWIL
jgi:uncharacterized phiE125 gp8 family phage protein